MEQLSLLDLITPPPAPPKTLDVPDSRDVTTEAYGGGYVIRLHVDEPAPMVVEVRGIPCLVRFHFGLQTYATQKPGSPFWSETGFRSFSVASTSPDRIDEIVRMIEQYIDAPAKDGNGCGGRLVRWWPGYVQQWRGDLAFILTYGQERSQLWEQWGPERHAEIWATKDADIAAAVARMWSEGIDPNDVGPPDHFKGEWPFFREPE